MARKEKQRQKMERRLERKQNRGLAGPEGSDVAVEPALGPDGEPLAADEPIASPDAESDDPVRSD